MRKINTCWYSMHLQQNVEVVCYGHHGVPVLVFPTAGGDAEEVERFLMIRVLTPLIEAGRIKVYSCDSISGQAWTDGRSGGGHRAWVQQQFDAFIYQELVPAIRLDCQTPDIEIIVTGASIGAFNAFAAICRHPDVFKAAICMSGTFNLEKYLSGEFTQDFYFSSPCHFLPDLGNSRQLAKLRERFILMVVGDGRWESPEYSWSAANLLGSKGIPNRVDLWSDKHDHDWPSWREWLPKYLNEMVP